MAYEGSTPGIGVDAQDGAGGHIRYAILDNAGNVLGNLLIENNSIIIRFEDNDHRIRINANNIDIDCNNGVITIDNGTGSIELNGGTITLAGANGLLEIS
jgi:hypothetical protein